MRCSTWERPPTVSSGRASWVAHTALDELVVERSYRNALLPRDNSPPEPCGEALESEPDDVQLLEFFSRLRWLMIVRPGSG